MEKLSLKELLGLEKITLRDYFYLFSLFVILMVYTAIVNPAMLGSAFLTAVVLTYIIIVVINIKRADQYDP